MNAIMLGDTRKCGKHFNPLDEAACLLTTQTSLTKRREASN